METQKPADTSEPEINREEILILHDEHFNPGNVCIVSGVGTVIGRATSVAGAAIQLTVVGLDINEMVFVKTDLSQDDDIENAFSKAAKARSIKYLVNIAGIQHIDAIENFPMEKYDLMQKIMLRAPFYLSKLTIPHMRSSDDGIGVIGNMASIHAHICTKNKPIYNITKFGLKALSQSISAEGEGKIRSFTISTGFVKTALALNQISAQAEQRGISEDEVVPDEMMGKSRTKEMMSPIEVANLFVFGFSRYARYLIGGDLLFDGGVVLTY